MDVLLNLYRDGGSRCGLFCVLDSTTERMDTEIEVDLFNSVIRARTAQPHFIPSQVIELLRLTILLVNIILI